MPVYAEGSLVFSDWGVEIADLGQYQNKTNTLVDSGEISALDLTASFSVEYLIEWRFRNKTLAIKCQGAVIKTVKVQANANGRMVIPRDSK